MDESAKTKVASGWRWWAVVFYALIGATLAAVLFGWITGYWLPAMIAGGALGLCSYWLVFAGGGLWGG